MSKCISREGEYSEHSTPCDLGEFVCGRCFVFDEDAVMSALNEARVDTAHAIALERERIAEMFDRLARDEMWADISMRYRLAAESIRNGEHWRDA